MDGSAFIERCEVAATGQGALDGLTFATKDVIDLAGYITGCGNPAWRATHGPAPAHAACIEQVLAAGARCVGKTLCDEFQFSLVGENHFYGTPLNPAAPDRVPGGSSSGSASAVAQGLADFSLGTDTGGSIRVPASNCNIWGFRPTHGRISVAGVQSLAPTFDTVGVLAGNLDVLRKVAGVLTGKSQRKTAVEKIFLLEDAWKLSDFDVQAALRPIAEKLGLLSVSLPEVCTEGELLNWKKLYSDVQWTEVWNTFGTWIESAEPEVGPRAAANLELVRNHDRTHFSEYIDNRNLARAELQAFLKPGIILCLPSSPTVAPRKGHVNYDRVTGDYLPRALAFTAIAGVGGLPQISLPLGRTSEGLPIGLSFIGWPYGDESLLEFAGTLV